jgi:hypothetical protein
MSEHKYKFNVTMACGGCSGAVERVIKKLEGKARFLLPRPAAEHQRLTHDRRQVLRSQPREAVGRDRHRRRRPRLQHGAVLDQKDGQEGHRRRGRRRFDAHRGARCVGAFATWEFEQRGMSWHVTGMAGEWLCTDSTRDTANRR